MTGKHLHIVWKLRQPLQGVEESLGAFARLDGQVGPRRVADEQRISRQSQALVDHERAMLGAVSGRVDDTHGDGAHAHDVAVLERLEGILGLCERMDGNGDALLERESSMSGDVVGVRVRLEHAHDA